MGVTKRTREALKGIQARLYMYIGDGKIFILLSTKNKK